MSEYKSINVCNLIPLKEYDDLQTIMFVLENSPEVFNQKTFLTYNRAILILEGEGVLHRDYDEFKFCKGDIIFELPARFYSIDGSADLKICYIGYIGLEAFNLLNNLKINYNNFIFKSNEKITNMWLENVNAKNGLESLASKSVLLYTLLEIGKTTLQTVQDKKSQVSLVKVKKYIDENYSDKNLNLKTVAKKFYYSPKYLSMLFEKTLKTGFSKYLQLVRLHNAYSMIENGYSSVQEIAYSCGYNDPLYFSRAFKKAYNISPKDKIKQNK